METRGIHDDPLRHTLAEIRAVLDEAEPIVDGSTLGKAWAIETRRGLRWVAKEARRLATHAESLLAQGESLLRDTGSEAYQEIMEVVSRIDRYQTALADLVPRHVAATEEILQSATDTFHQVARIEHQMIRSAAIARIRRG